MTRSCCHSQCHRTELWPLFSNRSQAHIEQKPQQTKLINIYIEASVASAANASSPFFANISVILRRGEKVFPFFVHLGLTLEDSSLQCQSQRAMATERNQNPHLSPTADRDAFRFSLFCDERSRIGQGCTDSSPRNGWMIVFRAVDSRFVDGLRYLSFLPNNEYAIYMHWLASARGKKRRKTTNRNTARLM